MSILQKHNWPGNVRELKNILERILISNQSNEHYTITTENLPEEILAEKHEDKTPSNIKLQPLQQAISNLEYKLITQALKKTNDNITNAAQLLETSYRVLKYKIDKLGIK